MRRKGELSPAAIDRGWPFQIVFPARLCDGGGCREIHEFCKGMTLCNRGHAVFHDGEWFTDDELLAMLKPCPDADLKIWPVNTRVGNVRNKGPELALPV